MAHYIRDHPFKIKVTSGVQLFKVMGGKRKDDRNEQVIMIVLRRLSNDWFILEGKKGNLLEIHKQLLCGMPLVSL